MSIKEKLSIAFHPQTESQTERRNRMIEAYFRVFINHQRNNWARLLSMTEFVYNNIKDASMQYTTFLLNFKYHLQVSHKENIDSCSKCKVVDELTEGLRNLIATCKKNLELVYELKKQAYNKETKPRSYTLNKKIWFNSKYIQLNIIGS